MNTQTTAEKVTHPDVRFDWTRDELNHLYELPFGDLLAQAHEIHARHFDPNEVQISTLLLSLIHI